MIVKDWIRLALPCLLALVCSYLPGQSIFDNPTVFTEENGLLDNYITAIKLDKQNFTWIGSTKGLARFDGKTFKYFLHDPEDPHSIAHNQALALYQDHKDRLWVGTYYGLSLYQEATQDFKNYRNSEIASNNLLPNSRVNAIVEDQQQQLWVGLNEAGLAKYDEARDTFWGYNFSVDNQDSKIDASRVNSIIHIAPHAQNDSLLWLATLSGLVLFNKHTEDYQWFFFEMEDSNDQFLSNSLKYIIANEANQLYLASWHGLLIYDIGQNSFRKVTIPNEPKSIRMSERTVFSLLSLPDGRLGVSYSLGFAFYDPKNDRFDDVFYNQPKEGKIYGAEFIDPQGRIWARSDHGLYIFDPLTNQFESHYYPVINTDFGYNSRALVESIDGQQLYIAADRSEGIQVFDRPTQSWDLVRISPKDANEYGALDVQDMIRLQDGRIIIGGNNELYEFLEKERKIVPFLRHIDMGAPFIRRMIQDKTGFLWIATRRRGLFKINLQTGQSNRYDKEFELSHTTTRHRWMEKIGLDKKGQLWIRMANNYSLYLPDEDRFVNIHVQDINSPKFFPNVAGFAESGDGKMWIAGADMGVGVADPMQVEEGVLRRYSAQDSLKELFVQGVSADYKGHIWLLHEKGITHVNPFDTTFQYFYREYGLPPFITYFIQPLSTGEMAISLPNGICFFHPDSLKINTEHPKPYLTSFKVFDDEIGDSMNLNTVNEVSLSYRQNFFSFEFAAKAYSLPNKITFAYQLEGVDEDWKYSGQRNYVSYNSLGGGDYTFRVKAANNEGEWNEEPLKLKIHITTPWWQTLLFWLLILLLLVMITALAIRFRINQIKETESIKTDFEKRLANVELNALRAQMNPHFIFNCLNSIDYYIIKNDTETASDYLNRFSRLIRLILQNSRSNYVNLKDELEALKLYIEMECLRFEKQFDYVVSVDKEIRLEEIEIPPMLLQPYVENAIWHGLMQKESPGRLDLTFTRQNGSLHCTIEDDGIGRKAAQQLKSKSATRHKSMGMRITDDRIKMINRLYQTETKVTVTDMTDSNGTPKGTRVELSISL